MSLILPPLPGSQLLELIHAIADRSGLPAYVCFAGKWVSDERNRAGFVAVPEVGVGLPPTVPCPWRSRRAKEEQSFEQRLKAVSGTWIGLLRERRKRNHCGQNQRYKHASFSFRVPPEEHRLLHRRLKG